MTEWKIYRLGEIATMKYGKLPPKNNSGQYPIWSGYRNVGFTDTYNCSKGTIIVVARGVGGTGDVKIAKEDCFLTNLSIAVNIDTDICLPQYFYYKFYLSNLRYLDSGSAQSQITIDDLKRLQISLPSLEEQRRIAGILGAIDDKIENNRRINTNLELQAQALFGNLISNSNLEYKLIADIEHLIETGRRPKGGVANIANGVPSIGAENIKGLGKYDYSKTKYITEEFAQSLKKGFVKGYELLIYKDGGKPGYFIPNFSIFGEGFPYEKMALNEHVFLLDFGDRGYNFFAYFYMQTEEVMKYLNAQGSKAAIPGINRNDVESIAIPTIENKTVKEFCARVEPIISAILTNAKESSRLATLRDTLLPKLMNGEIKITE